MQNRIFSIDDGKASKSQAYGYIDAIHYLAPFDSAGVGNVCGHASPGCINLCLGLHSGRAAIPTAEGGPNACILSRQAKTRRFMRERQAYLQDVVISIALAVRRAKREGMKVAIRLNGSSDIAWESIKVTLTDATAARLSRIMGYSHCACTYPSLLALFPRVQFLDYTKSAKRCMRKLPHNYHLTFSRNETNEAQCLELLREGYCNVSVIFETVPATWHGYRVIDGDKHDLRHLDPCNVIVGLTPKGKKAKADRTGCIVRS